MAEILIMPKLGFNMDEGQLVKWYKNVGDAVTKGEILFEINTDKTTMPVEATQNGTLLKIMVQEFETVPVFTPIAVIGQVGEDFEAALSAFKGAEQVGHEPKVQVAEQIEQVEKNINLDKSDLKLTPKAKKLIQDENINLASIAEIKGTGYLGGITAKDIKASPLAQKIAELKGINLSTVSGSGEHGKIMKNDVLNAQPLSHSSQSENLEKQVATRTAYKMVRKIIGERLASSKFSAPHVYFSSSVDVTKLNKFRQELHETNEGKFAISDLLILAVSRALRKFPEINTSLINEEIVCYKSINVGLAVAGNAGLIVPVVKNTQNKSLSDIAIETRDLIERAKQGRLNPEEYTNGTFTISNLGPFGIEDFTAIINPPESAILAISAVIKKPVVIIAENGEEQIAIRPLMNIRLSVDHRIIDGLLAANFVKYVKDTLENPLRILI